MKAKEYYEKYKAGLISSEKETYLPAISGFISDLLNEAATVAETRHVRFDRGIIPILREQNMKYKAVIRLFEKEYGASPIRENGFEIVLEDNFPGILKKMNGHPAPLFPS